MKTVIFYIAFISAAWAMPKGQTLPPFKRLYVDPSTDLPLKDLNPRIMNGKEVVPHSIPFQVYLIVSQNVSSRWFCGGTLISPNHVLTAAHCLVNGVNATAYFGAHDIRLPSEDSLAVIKSKNLIYHTEFNMDNITNDIGVVVLDEPVELSKYINVVSLPTRKDVGLSYYGKNARVSGWGVEYKDGQPSPVLREVNSTVLANIQCGLTFYNITDSQVCIAGYGGVGACGGDSGGPLVVENTLIGIVSYVASGCRYGYPSAFTRITSYLDWIEQNTGIVIL